MPRRDIDVRAIAWAGFAIAATIAVVVCTVFVLLHVWRVSPAADRARLPYALVTEGPALQSAPQPELAAERAAKARLLTTSAWVDDAHGIVRIPIAAAMRVLVAESAGASAPASAAVASASAASTAPRATSPRIGATSEAGSTR